MLHELIREMGILGVLSNSVACLFLPIVVVGLVDSQNRAAAGVLNLVTMAGAVLFVAAMDIYTWRVVRRRLDRNPASR
jgi:hypothetical protein